MKFDLDSTGIMTATFREDDGSDTVYTAEYTAGEEVHFYGADGALAFSIQTTLEPPVALDITFDATISASNIAVSAAWQDDSLYITTTKLDPVTKPKPSLSLTGKENPVWLSNVAYKDVEAGENVENDSGANTVFNIPDGAYIFKYDAANSMISVEIDGITYRGKYEQNKVIELTSGLNPDGTENPALTQRVGLVITTNSKAIGTKDSENTATLKTVTGAAADNLNKLKVALATEDNYYSVSGFTGSFQEFIVSFESQMSSDEDQNNNLMETSVNIINSLSDRRDATSAVSVDEEGVNMMTYQNYYNAAARYMTALDEALDKVINGMGIVGR
jgi:flagellar hook-associated protein FlgK